MRSEIRNAFRVARSAVMHNLEPLVIHIIIQKFVIIEYHSIFVQQKNIKTKSSYVSDSNLHDLCIHYK